MKKAPWNDFEGVAIFEGDTIRHPDGNEGVVVLDDQKVGVGIWRVRYGDETELWLGNQIGENGQGVVVPPNPTR